MKLFKALKTSVYRNDAKHETHSHTQTPTHTHTHTGLYLYLCEDLH